MAKLIGEPVKVHQKQADEDTSITAFIWRKKLYRVNEVINWWREPADWWAGNTLRFFVQVDATGSATCTYELYKMGESWFLSRVLD
jgi:hypothetical protein